MPRKNHPKEVDPVQTQLDQIAAKMKRGMDPALFQKELDVLLGTELEDRDAIAEESWEDSYRNQGNDE